MAQSQPILGGYVQYYGIYIEVRQYLNNRH